MPATDIPWVTTSSAAWDPLFLGPPGALEKFPGLCSIKIKGGLEVERKKPKGKTGEKLTVHGLKACELDITIRVWTAAQNAELNRLFPLIEPSDDFQGKVPDPLEIAHPTTTNRQVSSIIITDLDGPNITKGPFREYAIRAIQYRPEPAKTVGGTVKGGKGSTQAEIDQLVVRKIGLEARRFALLLSNPRSEEQEAEFQAVSNELAVIDNKLRENQARQNGGNLPPTAPAAKPTTTTAAA